VWRWISADGERAGWLYVMEETVLAVNEIGWLSRQQSVAEHFHQRLKTLVQEMRNTICGRLVFGTITQVPYITTVLLGQRLDVGCIFGAVVTP